MARRQWSNLSATYRKRLERGGITKRSYEAGESLKEARGHRHTPEHPLEAMRNPQKYPTYYVERANLIRDVQERKRILFGASKKWNGPRSLRMIKQGTGGAHPPSNAQLRWALKATEDEIMEALEGADDDISFLFYH